MKKLENLTWNMTGELPESDFNLTKDYAPVNDIVIEVRALENIKNISVDSGKKKMNLIKNHTYALKKSDIEHYLRRGMLVINE